MKRTKDFANFPIPLGAEWLHVERGVFDEIINNSSIQADMETTPYDNSKDYGLFEGRQVTPSQIGLLSNRNLSMRHGSIFSNNISCLQ